MSAEALAGLYDSRVKSSPNDDSSSIVDWERLKTGGRLLAGPDHLRNWNALTREIDAAALAALVSAGDWAAVRDRAASNLLYYRANYARCWAGWGALCALWRPLRALWLTALAASWFGALVVLPRVELELAQGKAALRHGSLHATVGKSRVHLTPPQVLGALGAITALVVLLTGSLWTLVYAVPLPAVLCAAHAAVRKPSMLAELPRMRTELAYGLRAALSEEAAATDEMEEGTGAPPPPRDEELARRVDAIRQKYRPPASSSGKSD